MCLIIVPDQDKPLVVTKSQFEDIHRRNDDGYGFMWTRNGRVRAIRGIGKIDSLLEMYEQVKNIPGCVFHARMATHGTISLDNTHPFKVTPFIAMVHNGIMSNVAITENGKSDTWHLAYKVFPDLVQRSGGDPSVPASWDFVFDDKKWGEVFEKWLGSSNKLVLVHEDGRRVVFNEHTGTKRDGQWYSNTYAAGFLNTYSYSGNVYQRYRTGDDWDEADDKVSSLEGFMSGWKRGSNGRWEKEEWNGAHVPSNRQYDLKMDDGREKRQPKMLHDPTGKYGVGVCHICDGTAWRKCAECDKHVCRDCSMDHDVTSLAKDGSKVIDRGAYRQCFQCMAEDEADAEDDAAVAVGAVVEDEDGNIIEAKPDADTPFDDTDVTKDVVVPMNAKTE